MRMRSGMVGPAAAGVTTFAALLAALLGAVGAPSAAHGQMVFATTQQIGGASESPISRRSVERYAGLLELDETQREVVLSLHEGYAAAAQEANADFQDAVMAARRAFEDTGDPSVFMEEMPEARRTQRETLEQLETQFFDDLSLLLTDGQRERIPRVERMRRRETLLPAGSLSGETVDLTDVVEGLGLDASAEGLSETLVQYEIELDRALVARDRIQREAREAMDFRPGQPFQFDEERMEEMRENSAKVRKAALGVKAVNDRYARLVASKLPEDRRGAFESAYHERSFPQVYRTSSTQHALEAARDLGDLTEDQRRAIDDLVAAHERSVRAANERWAAAIEESEEEEDGSMAFGGMTIRMGMEDSDSPVGEARQARRELDERTREKLLALLTEDQRQRLPERRERQRASFVPEGGVVGERQMVIEIEEEGGG